MSSLVIIVAVTTLLVLNIAQVALTWDHSDELIVSKESTTFLDAYIRCHQQGFDAVEILSEEDEKEVEKVLRNDSSIANGWQNGFWIFAVNVAKTCNYYWLDTGKPLIYNNFGPSQPDNSAAQNCLLISKKVTNGVFEWHDAPCETKFRFLCKYSKKPEHFERGLLPPV